MKKIHVTKTFLPSIEEYESLLTNIWSSGQLTNQGPLLNDFEIHLKQYLEVPNMNFVANGTLALQLAIRALELGDSGEIITTPFSYVASTSAILWERYTPIFVDIDKDSLCIDPDKIEESITENTKAILAVHVFGNICEVDKIEKIAKKHKLKVIYDGAHAFGVRYRDKSIFSYGDVSICSFHSTKLFHTIEGGMVVTKENQLADKVFKMKKFGHIGDEHFTLGINAKASEFQAAMGLINLKYIDDNIQLRKRVCELYDSLLPLELKAQVVNDEIIYNYSYYPVVLKDEAKLKKVVRALANKNIYPRRYFYPSLNLLPYLEETNPCPVSEDVASRIIALPLYESLEEEDIKNICEVINNEIDN